MISAMEDSNPINLPGDTISDLTEKNRREQRRAKYGIILASLIRRGANGRAEKRTGYDAQERKKILSVYAPTHLLGSVLYL